jgi:Tfp pilus assembly protein PilE
MQKKIVAHENYLRAQLRHSATTLENYAAQNNGRYPATNEELIDSGNSWLLSEKERRDTYRITTELTPAGYRITAEPDSCGLSGNKIFTLQTNGTISEENCFKESDWEDVN